MAEWAAASRLEDRALRPHGKIYIHVLNLRSMYKIDRRGNRILGNYPDNNAVVFFTELIAMSILAKELVYSHEIV